MQPSQGTLARSKVVEREGWACDRAKGEGEEGPFRIVTRDAVGLDGTACCAAMDEGPFAAPKGTSRWIAPNFDGDCHHRSFAWAGTVARRVVNMSAVQAGWTVVAVLGTPGLAWHLQFAVDAGEAVGFVAARTACVLAPASAPAAVFMGVVVGHWM